jgi:hypothetical protein
MDFARSLIVDSQGRAPTPCSGLNADPNTDLEMMMSEDSAPQLLDGFDWPRAGEVALDQLPDSDLWYRPDYELTQEWFEKTIKYLKETDEEKRVAAEREVDKSAEIGADMETG